MHARYFRTLVLLLASIFVFPGAKGGCTKTSTTPSVQAEDCAGTPNGTATIDECGTCDADTTNNCTQDCAGSWGGSAVIDNCGSCDADATNDCTQDCADTWGGNAVLDNCGTCDADATNDCTQDCADTWGGNAVLDNCSTCDDDATNDCTQDCADTWGGTAVVDECGICDDDPSNDNSTCCGNDQIDDGEECDGSNLAQLSCADLPAYQDQLAGGNLGCSDSCTFDTSDCKPCWTYPCGPYGQTDAPDTLVENFSFEPANQAAIDIAGDNNLLELSDLYGMNVEHGGTLKGILFYQAAAWCPYCAQTSRYLNELYLKHKDEGILFVAVLWQNASREDASIEDAVAYANDYDWSFPTVIGKIPNKYNPSMGVPSAINLDAATMRLFSAVQLSKGALDLQLRTLAERSGDYRGPAEVGTAEFQACFVDSENSSSESSCDEGLACVESLEGGPSHCLTPCEEVGVNPTCGDGVCVELSDGNFCFKRNAQRDQACTENQSGCAEGQGTCEPTEYDFANQRPMTYRCKEVCDGSTIGTQSTCGSGESCLKTPLDWVHIEGDAQCEDDSICGEGFECRQISASDDNRCAKDVGWCSVEASLCGELGQNGPSSCAADEAKLCNPTEGSRVCSITGRSADIPEDADDVHVLCNPMGGDYGVCLGVCEAGAGKVNCGEGYTCVTPESGEELYLIMEEDADGNQIDCFRNGYQYVDSLCNQEEGFWCHRGAAACAKPYDLCKAIE